MNSRKKYSTLITFVVLFSSFSKAQEDSLTSQIGLTMNGGVFGIVYAANQLYIDVNNKYNAGTSSYYPGDFGWGLEYINRKWKFPNRLFANYNDYKASSNKFGIRQFTLNVGLGREFYFKRKIMRHFILGSDLFYGKANYYVHKYPNSIIENDMVCLAPFVAYKHDFKKRWQFRTAINVYGGWMHSKGFLFIGYQETNTFTFFIYKSLSFEIHYKF